MRLKILPVLLFVLGIAVRRAPAGTLSIDGVSVGPIMNWSGGDGRAQVVTDATGGKQLSQPSYDPVVVEAPLPLAAPLISWINEFAAGRHTAKNLVLAKTDLPMGVPTATTTLEAGNAYLTAVRFPFGDTGDRSHAIVELVFGISQARVTSLPVQAGGTTVRTAASSQRFRLAVAGLDASKVSQFGSIEIRLASDTSESGDTRTATATGPVRLSNLTVTMPDSAAAGWKTWFADFAITGNNDNTREKAGSLEFLTGDLSTVVLHLQLSQMGIARLTRQQKTPDAAITVQAELYFERLSVVTPPPAASSTTQTQPPPADPTPAPSTTATDPATTPPPAIAPAPATDMLAGTTRVPVVTENSDVARLRPDAMVLPPASTITVASSPTQSTPTVATAQAGGTNSADEGSRDPIEFPRVGGLTRLTFSGSTQKNYVRESATYASVDDLRRVMDTVVRTATDAGWQQISLSETGDRTVGRAVNAEWTKGSIRAQMNLTDRKPSGTTVTLWVAGEKSGG